jgi:UDP-N-acetylmuramoyl-tripeptide--D-alanyl-D-alanine ligase
MIKRLMIRILAAAARRAIRREKPVIVAITGSLGKSSTKEAIAVAMGAHEPGSSVRASRKNYNNEFGVPFTILNVMTPGKDPLKWLVAGWSALWIGWGFGRINAQTLILEMGADHPGDLAWLVGIAPPTISVVTSVAEAHSEFFGSIDEVAKEKAALVRVLHEKGLAILNNDDPRVTAMRKEMRCPAVYFGASEGSDVRILSTSIATETDEHGHIQPVGLGMTIEMNGRQYDLVLRGTIGRPQAFAVACAFAVAQTFRVPAAQVIERLERDYHGIAGRTRVIPGIKGTTIIDDSYNAASPLAVISALRDLASIPVSAGQRRIAALGDMRELGLYSDKAHQDVGHVVADIDIDFLVTCGTLGRAIAHAAIGQGFPESRTRSLETSEDVGLFLQELIAPGDLVLIKGSQGSRMEKAVKEIMAEPLEAPFLLVRMSDEWQKG